jgi:hypothetical protein
MLVGYPYRDDVMGHDLVVARRQTHIGHPCLDEGLHLRLSRAQPPHAPFFADVSMPG